MATSASTTFSLEGNRELELAYQFIEQTDMNVFLTGKAGTGKTTFLRNLREQSPKRMVVVAPTGVAAINAGGVTIHSFFQLPLSPYIPGITFSESGRKQYTFSKEKKNILRSLDLLVIDEISMVRADLLDAIDSVLRRYKDHTRPFGGIQLLMIGDLQQLSPVVKEHEMQLLTTHYPTFYFFGSHALQQSSYVTIELKTIYRQTDQQFVNILNAIREQKIDNNLLMKLNERYIPEFKTESAPGYIRLTTHNYTAQQYNENRLAALPSKSYSFEAEIKGNFNEALYPADAYLQLKQGAQVMFIRNDETGQGRYYNGKIGHVQTLTANGIIVRCEDDGTAFNVEPSEWNNSKYILDENTKEIREEIEGTFRQYPLRLAWAITIHKSQGLTFEKAVIDAASSFAHGQVYVALSRCKTLEGLVLASPVTSSAIISDNTVADFMHSGTSQTEEATHQLKQLKYNYFYKLLNELFCFQTLQRDFEHTLRLLDEYFYKLYPTLILQYKECNNLFKEKLTTIEEKFRQQYTSLMQQSTNYTENTYLQERIQKAANYFQQTLDELMLKLLANTQVETDNQTIRKRMNEAIFNLRESFYLKRELMKRFTDTPFYVSAYLQAKAVITLKGSDTLFRPLNPEKKSRKKGRQTNSVAESIPTDIHHPQLYRELQEWRRKKSEELSLPTYTILKQNALICMANFLPQTMKELIETPFFGKISAEKYGDEILTIIRKYKS